MADNMSDLKLKVENLKSILIAQDEIISWYEDDHDRYEYDDEEVPEELLELEQQLEAAKEFIDAGEGNGKKSNDE